MWRRGWTFDVARSEAARTPTAGARSGRLTNSPASANVTLVIPRVADPLVVSPRGGHIPRDPPVRIPPSGLSYSPILSPLTLHASRFKSSCGGEGGIRTHGPIAGTHAFQACRFDHSRTSPYRFSRGGILTCGLVTGKVTSRAHRHGFDPPWSTSYTAKKSRGGVAMRVLIRLGILAGLQVTAIMLFASTFTLYSNSSRFFHRLSVAE